MVYLVVRAPGLLLLAAALPLAACSATAPPPPPVYASSLDADEAAAAVPPVYAHVEAEGGSVLQRVSPREQSWKDVCSVPCDGYVPAYGSYRVSTADRRRSEEFTLPGPPGTRVALKVEEDGRVWTTDSVELAARRRGGVVPIFFVR